MWYKNEYFATVVFKVFEFYTKASAKQAFLKKFTSRPLAESDVAQMLVFIRVRTGQEIAAIWRKYGTRMNALKRKRVTP